MELNLQGTGSFHRARLINPAHISARSVPQRRLLGGVRVRDGLKGRVKVVAGAAAVSQESSADESLSEGAAELTGEALALSRTFLFACDDSDECVKGAEILFDTLVKEGDTVHFVHVICDDRGYSTSIDTVFTEAPRAVTDVEGLTEEYRSHIEASGADMMRKHYSGFAERNIRTQFHLPVISGPDSSAKVGSVICSLGEKLNVDALVMVTPHRGTLSEFGSVGHHCYHHTCIPMLAVPVKSIPAKGTMNKTILIIGRDNDEISAIRDWMTSYSAVLKKMSIEELNLGKTYGAPNAVELLCTKMRMTYPRLTIMLSQAHVSLEDELVNPSFAPEFCSKSVSPVLILPKAMQQAQRTTLPVVKWTVLPNLINA